MKFRRKSYVNLIKTEKDEIKIPVVKYNNIKNLEEKGVVKP